MKFRKATVVLTEERYGRTMTVSATPFTINGYCEPRSGFFLDVVVQYGDTKVKRSATVMKLFSFERTNRTQKSPHGLKFLSFSAGWLPLLSQFSHHQSLTETMSGVRMCRARHCESPMVRRKSVSHWMSLSGQKSSVNTVDCCDLPIFIFWQATSSAMLTDCRRLPIGFWTNRRRVGHLR